MENLLLQKKFRFVSITIAVVGFVLAVLYFGYNEPRPVGTPGHRALQMAHQMEKAVHLAAWKKTGAIRWSFRDQNDHLWDRKRNFARVRWDDIEVLINLKNQTGFAFSGGQRVDESRGQELIEKAYQYWANDSFWLNPIAKLRDKGVALGVVQIEKTADKMQDEGLLVTYSSGGVTPGDSYLWIVDAQGTPLAWRMWVSILPIGGLEATFEDWQRLSTGALVSTTHRLPLGLTLRLSNIRAAGSLVELEGKVDPFQMLEGDKT